MGKSVSDENLLAFGQQFKQQLDPVIADSRGHVYYGQVDSTSKATVFTATIPGIAKYEKGLTIVLKNGVVTSDSGFTLNINGLGALPAYTNLADKTRETTIFNINYTLMFIYENRVSGGNWLVYRGYDSNTNTIGYQLRTNSTVRNVSDTARYYKIYFTSANGQMWVPASVNSSSNATSARPVNQRPIDPFGPIVYTSANTNFTAGSNLAAASIWQQYNLTLGYSFNRTGAALKLTTERPVYVKCAPQTDGSAIMDASEPIVQDLPTSKDGKIYIYLGLATGATTCELQVWHPVYWHDGTGIRIWTGAEPSSGGITGTGVTAIVVLTQSEYDALATKDPTTLYFIKPAFPIGGSGTQEDQITGWYENVAKMVNPTGAANGTFTGTLSGIYNYFINNVTTIDGPTDYEHNRGNTAFLVGEEETYYPTVVTSGNNINIQYTEGNKPYLINTNTYQKAGTIVIYPTDVVEFNLKED